MQKVATRPHARQMPHEQAASFSIYGSILYKNRQALPVRDTSHGNDLHTASFIPYYYLYYETIVRLSREKGLLQHHFMQKNRAASAAEHRPCSILFQIHPAQPHQARRGQAVLCLQIVLRAAKLAADRIQHKGGCCLLYTSPSPRD